MDSQMSIFDYIRQPISLAKPIRLIELFGGIGATSMALERLGANFEHYRLVEFDKYPVASYNAIHGTDFAPLDVSKVKGVDLGITDKDKYSYILTYSYPCQDLSVAGKQKGMKKGSGTRSGLLWEVERLLTECELLPDVLVMENVPMVHSNANIDDFRQWIDFLESIGYSNYWQDFNARDFGIPQNRDRTIMVSIFGEFNYKFPVRIPLMNVMKDYLEDEVDDRYYLKTEKAKKLIDTLIAENKILDETRRDEQLLTSASKTQELLTGQTVLKQDTMMGSQTCKQMVPVLLSGMSSDRWNPDAKEIETACTLCARDYKGFNNYGHNGVIECERIK